VGVGIGANCGGDVGGNSEQDDLSNLVMAWYHCGFFTAKYQERHGNG